MRVIRCVLETNSCNTLRACGEDKLSLNATSTSSWAVAKSKYNCFRLFSGVP